MSRNPFIYLARHGQTAWSLSGQHTGVTDLPLTKQGETDARELGKRILSLKVAKVLVSPLLRVRQTCDLTGFGDVAEIERDLVEWNYGQYEGRTTHEIRAERSDWQLFRDGCPGGESPAEIGARADRVVAKIRNIGEDVLLFSSGHISRVLAARWLGLDASAGRFLLLSTATLSTLGYEHDLSEPVIRLWNDNWQLAMPTDHCH